MSYLPTLLGLATALCWGSSDYLSRRQSENVGHYNTTVYMHVTTLVILLLLIPVLNPPLHATAWPASALMAAGALNFFAFIFLYRAFHKGVVSVVAPVAYSYPAVTTVVSVVALGIVLAATRLFAITAIILGVVLLSMRYSELKNYTRGNGRPTLTAGVGSAIGSAVSFGLVYVVVGYATPSVGYYVPVLFLRGVATLVGFLLAPAFRAGIRPTKASFSPTMIIMGALESVGFLSFNLGVSFGADSLPVVAALSGMGGAIAAAYAMVLLKERLEKNQLLGAVISVAGVFALLYFQG
jgi:drug/metabolite transporter (DMT)-like permease